MFLIVCYTWSIRQLIYRAIHRLPETAQVIFYGGLVAHILLGLL